MSKSEWKEHPLWNCDADYNFFEKTKVQEVAWEALRRNPEYRNDYAAYDTLLKKHGQNWRKQPQAVVFVPERQKDEAEKNWFDRIVTADQMPRKIPLDVYLQEKWGINGLHDPQRPRKKTLQILGLATGYPKKLDTPDDFMNEVTEEASTGVQHVRNELVIVAFEVNQPHAKQLEAAQEILKAWQDKLKAAGAYNDGGGNHRGKINVWKRHIRILDALRMKKPAKASEIGEFFGNSKDKNVQRKDGERYIRLARDFLKQHRKIVMHSGTSSKDTP